MLQKCVQGQVYEHLDEMHRAKKTHLAQHETRKSTWRNINLECMVIVIFVNNMYQFYSEMLRFRLRTVKY